MSMEQERREFFPVFQQAMELIDNGFTPIPAEDSYLNQLLESYKNGISKKQIQISYNKWLHGFNTDNVGIDLALLVGEMSEVLEAHSRRDREDMILELADVAIYCYGIAQMLGKDLDTAIAIKMDEFFNRTYRKDD